MIEEEREKQSQNIDEAQLEREIRQDRKFSMAESIARRAGKKLLKGGSPITSQQQAELIVERYLQQNLSDTEGALRVVLERRVRESESLFKRGYQQPLTALRLYVEGLLGSDGLLEDFVREVDAMWGQIYYERPHFQEKGAPPDADDPYTFESVRRKLTRLIEQLWGV